MRPSHRRRTKYPIDLLVTDVVCPAWAAVNSRRNWSPCVRASACSYLSGYTEDAIVTQGALSPGLAHSCKSRSRSRTWQRKSAKYCGIEPYSHHAKVQLNPPQTKFAPAETFPSHSASYTVSIADCRQVPASVTSKFGCHAYYMGWKMLVKKQPEIPFSEVTPKDIYINRRKFLAAAAITGAAAATGLAFREFAESSARRAGKREDRWHAEKLFQHDGKANSLQRRHELQQLLRILDRQVRTRQLVEEFQDASLDGDHRRRRQEKASARCRHHHQDGRARRTYLPPSLCRRLVHRRALDRILAQ